MNIEQDNSTLENQLVEAIYDSLHNHIHSNASFLAERLLAEKDCEEYKNILAQCYLAENKPNKAYYILKDCKSEQSRYKFAISCIKINKFKEAEKALNPIDTSIKNSLQNKYENVPNGSAGLYLLGVIHERQQRCSEAKQYYLKALELNPTLWTAYERLLKMGENILPNKIFTENKYKLYENTKKTSNTNISPIKMSTKIKEQIKGTMEIQPISGQRARRSQNPPQFTSIAPKKKLSSTNQNSIGNIVTLLKRLADPFYNLSNYNCIEAVQQFKKLPPNHQNTGWVLSNIGRCYMEIVKYTEAEKYYAEAYRVEPYRLQGIEYYSSCLWHLKKQVQLCFLAHSALQKSLYTPETWIAVGNCFSLQKQHQHALKFFSRAIQLNNQNPYAYALCGHEHVYNEDFAKAKKMFENALNLDVRHYNAWWGLGNIAYKQQKYDKATENFNKAIGINPKNPVLYSFLGMTYAAKRQFLSAVKLFEKSQELDPKNGLNRYQKANSLVKLEKYQNAIEQLEKLQGMMPKQAPIPTLLGRIYKKLGKIDKAHTYFTLALDLESKDAQRIKGYIQNLHNTGGQFEEMDN